MSIENLDKARHHHSGAMGEPVEANMPRRMVEGIYALLGKWVKSKKLAFTGFQSEYNEIKTHGLLGISSEEVNFM